VKRYIVLLGPPGAGKGTQAQVIAQTLNLAHISSGEIFRENLKNQTELGKLARTYMDRGVLVPDDVTIAMIEARLRKADCDEGALLDGFPRTPVQAKALDQLLEKTNDRISCVPYINVPEETLIERLSGRWTCPVCGYVYHEKNNPPANPGVCDKDQGVLQQREDDKAETVQKRIDVYWQQTSPLIDYYRKMGLLVEVDGKRSIDEVSQQLLEEINKKAD
jgi:adenylate kinase